MDWTSLLVQAPIVGAFIWFSIEMQKRFAEALDKRDAAYQDRNDALCTALNATSMQILELTKHVITHDQRVENRIQAAQAETTAVIAAVVDRSAAQARKTIPRKPQQ